MSLNLVETTKQLFTHDLLTNTSAFLGETDSGVAKAIDGVIPAIFTGLVIKTATHAGAVKVAEMAGHQSHPDTDHHISDLAAGKGSGAVLDNIFGNNLTTLSSLISSFSGIKQGSASSLLAMAAPLILGFLGKHTGSNQLNADGLANLLSSQKQYIAAATPSGLQLDNIFSSTIAEAHTRPKKTNHLTSPGTSYTNERTGLGWVLIIVALALIAAATLYFFNAGCNSKVKTSTHASIGSTKP